MDTRSRLFMSKAVAALLVCALTAVLTPCQGASLDSLETSAGPGSTPSIPVNDSYASVNDSLKKIVLPGDSLLKDSLRIKPDSLLQRGDSLLLRPDSLTALNDSLVVSNDSIAAQPTTDQPADKPKKKNIFVRFFRWLFGIKD